MVKRNIIPKFKSETLKKKEKEIKEDDINEKMKERERKSNGSDTIPLIWCMIIHYCKIMTIVELLIVTGN